MSSVFPDGSAVGRSHSAVLRGRQQNYESETGIMRSQTQKSAHTLSEQAQFRQLDKLEKAMDTELRINCARTDEWISRLADELERPYCNEAKQRINWLLYRIIAGDYAEQEDVP